MKFVKVEIFTPVSDVTAVVEGLNEAELIQDHDYDYCYATTPVTGHFRPLPGATPHTGEVNQLTEVEEVKIECRILYDRIAEADQIIKERHSYEVPVINYIPLVDMPDR